MATVPALGQRQRLPFTPRCQIPQTKLQLMTSKSPAGTSCVDERCHVTAKMVLPPVCAICPTAVEEESQWSDPRTSWNSALLQESAELTVPPEQFKKKKKRRQFQWEDAYKLWFQKIGGKDGRVHPHTHIHTPTCTGECDETGGAGGKGVEANWTPNISATARGLVDVHSPC